MPTSNPRADVTSITPGDLCARTIEAGWLTIIVTVPLFFNVYSFRSFEPDKTALLTTIALVMLTAWVIKGLEHMRTPGRTPLTGSSLARLAPISLLVITLIFFLDYALASFWSVAPRISLWGSYHRTQGLYSLAAYMVVFLSMLSLIRRREQIERIVSAVLITGFAASVYGLIQHFGLDPIPLARDLRSPVISTMGNNIFAAAFVIMTIPLTLYRLFAATSGTPSHVTPHERSIEIWMALVILAVLFWGWWTGPITAFLACLAAVIGTFTMARILKKPTMPYVRIGAYLVILSAQIASLLLTESRGPFIGLLCGLGMFGLLWTLVAQKWIWHLAITGILALALLALVLIHIPNSSFTLSTDTPVFGRLLNVFATGGPARVRTLIWEGVTELMRADPVRTISGYGPDTQRLIFPPYYRSELGRLTGTNMVPDRAHNETFDVIASTGLLGFAIYYTFMLSIFFYAYKWTGILFTKRQYRWFVGSCIAGSVVAVLGARLIDDSWRFSGVAVSFGLLAGVVLYGNAFGLRQVFRPTPTGGPPSSTTLILIALYAAIGAHFAEIQFGIATVTTRGYFWMFTALLIAVGIAQPWPRSDPIPAATSRTFLAGCACMGLVLVTLMVDLTRTGAGALTESNLFWLFFLTFIFCGLVLLVESNDLVSERFGIWEWLRRLGTYAAFCLIATSSAHLLFQTDPGLDLDFHPTLLFYLALLFAAMIIVSHLIASPRKGRVAFGIRPIVYLPLWVGTLYLIGAFNAFPIQADIEFKRGWLAHKRANLGNAIEFFEEAVKLAPKNDHYLAYLGDAFARRAVLLNDRKRRDTYFAKAAASMREAARLSPLHPDHPANLARLYGSWALVTDDRVRREERLRRALWWFRKAVTLNPRQPRLWGEWGRVHALLSENDLARDKFEQALALDPEFVIPSQISAPH